MRTVRKKVSAILAAGLMSIMAVSTNAAVGDKVCSGVVPGTDVTLTGKTSCITGDYIACYTSLTHGISGTFPKVTAEVQHYRYGTHVGTETFYNKENAGKKSVTLSITLDPLYGHTCYTCHEVQGDYNYALYLVTQV